MTYGNDYRLAEKMKSRFSGRGAALSGMQASPTSELMKRAQMGGDPSVNCSELDFRDGVSVNRRGSPNVSNTQNAQTMRNAGYRPQYAQYASDAAGYGQRGGMNTRQAGRSDAGMNTERQRTNPANANSRPQSQAQAKVQSQRTAQDGASRTGSGSNDPRNPKEKTKKAQQKSKNKAKTKTKPKAVHDTEEITEIRAEGRRMTPMFAVFLVIGTMMIMSIVLSFSDIYQTTSEIAQLESDLADLKDTAAELELKLEEKNDIRVIEQIATEELGMVKEDAVQRKYLSLSDGERIDIIEDETESETKASGVLLSSIWSSLGSLFDYFR